MADTIKCPPCSRGDCRHHQHDFMDSDSRVRLCRCAHEPIEFKEVAPDVWRVAPGSQDAMQDQLDAAMQKAFGKTIKEMFPDA